MALEQLNSQGYAPEPSGLAGEQPVRMAGLSLSGLIKAGLGYDTLKTVVQAIHNRYGPEGVGKAAVGAAGVLGGAAAIPAIAPLTRALSGPPQPQLPPGFEPVDEPTARAASAIPPGFRFVDEATARAVTSGGAQPVPVTAVSDPNERVKAAFEAFPPPESRRPPSDLATSIINRLLTSPAH